MNHVVDCFAALISFEHNNYAVTEPREGETEAITLNVIRQGNLNRTSTVGNFFNDPLS